MILEAGSAEDAYFQGKQHGAPRQACEAFILLLPPQLVATWPPSALNRLIQPDEAESLGILTMDEFLTRYAPWIFAAPEPYTEPYA